MQVYHSQRCSGTSGLMVATTNGKKCDGSEEEVGAWHENRREDRECKCSYNAVKSTSRTISMRESSIAL